ncbi:MAG TPA: MarR family transcriptional regulator [Clostridia bacterium]|nr:MarR family transcriptional regulator [Clostridia bacterium]
MFGTDDIMDIILENIKKLFYPGDWMELDLKFSKSELFTMLYLDRRKETTMTELVEYINSPMSTATGIVDRLVKSGYIIRGRSETDRRIVVLTLTEEGKKLIEKLKSMMLGYINMAIDDLTEEETQFLTNIIFRIMNNLQKKLSAKVPGEKDEAVIKKIDIE